MNTTVAATNAERAEIPQFHGRHQVGFRPAIWISPPPQLDFRHIGALMVVSLSGTSIVNLVARIFGFSQHLHGRRGIIQRASASGVVNAPGRS
jgi:hypothetical protein